MKLESRTIEMTCSVIFTERETKMLGYLAGFGGEAIAERICNGLTAEFSKDEWIKPSDVDYWILKSQLRQTLPPPPETRQS